MKLRFTWLFTLFMVFVMQLSFAQEKVVSGIVTSAEDGSLVAGANVIVKGTLRGLQTNFDGEFSIDVSVGEILVFSFVSLKTREVIIGDENTINVALEEDVAALDEVIVVGYGTKRTVNETISASVVSAAQLEDRPIATLNNLLKGNATGIVINSGSGQPGANSIVRIRGISSLNAGTDPLYVIDGVPVISGDYSRLSTTSDVLSSLNSNDIESLTVLKDASATALYGARAANGVILITTKSGKSGEPRYHFSIESGFNNKAVEGPKRLSASEWAELNDEGLINAGEQAYIGYTNDVLNPNGNDSNWGDAIERGAANQQQVNFSVTGGTDQLRYYTSLGYFDQEGIINNSSFNRTSGRIKIDYKLSDKVKIGQNINVGLTNLKTLSDGGGFANPMLGKYFSRPSDPIYNEDGSYYIGADLSNPRLSNGLYNLPMLLQNNFLKARTLKLTGITDFSYEIMDAFTYSSRLSLDQTIIEEDRYFNPRHGDGFTSNGSAYGYDTRVFDYVFQNTLNYDFVLGEKNNFSVLLVQEAQKNQYRDLSAGAEGYGKEGFYTVSVGSKDVEANGKRKQYTNAAYLASVNFNHNSKYFLEGSFRREGNSNFAENNKWGSFWAISGAWDIAREGFFNQAAVNEIKLRVSYGQVGNASIGSTSSLDYFSFGGEYGGRIPLYVHGVVNPDLTWEVNKPLNFGLDFGLFNNRVTGSFDYFIKKTEDLLYSIPLSLTTGLSIELDDRYITSKFVNAGTLENRGYEVSLGARVFQGEFNWDTKVNFSFVENKLTSLLENDVIDVTKILREGESINTFYLRKWAGVDPANGDPLWYINGKDGATTNNYKLAERGIQGNSLPNYTGGFINNFSYKGFSVETLFTFALDYKVFDGWASYLQSSGTYTFSYPGYHSNLDRWQNPGDQALNPKEVYNNSNLNSSRSTRFLYNGDHIRFSNLQIGYDVAKVFPSKVFNSVLLYLRGTNLYTYRFDELLKYDPETRADGVLNLDLPPLRSYTFGVKVSF